ncbi:MAG: amidohydrolase family protein, partial [Myxococcota bacterium]
MRPDRFRRIPAALGFCAAGLALSGIRPAQGAVPEASKTVEKSSAIRAGTTVRPADLILTNGVVWTVDRKLPKAEAVAVRDDRIVFVGASTAVDRFRGAQTRVIDLKGRLLLPGFNDNHVHFDDTGRLLYGLSLLDVSDADAFASRIREVHARYAPGTWITGGDWSAYETWAANKVAKAGKKSSDGYGDLFTPHRR